MTRSRAQSLFKHPDDMPDSALSTRKGGQPGLFRSARHLTSQREVMVTFDPNGPGTAGQFDTLPVATPSFRLPASAELNRGQQPDLDSVSVVVVVRAAVACGQTRQIKRIGPRGPCMTALLASVFRPALCFWTAAANWKLQLTFHVHEEAGGSCLDQLSLLVSLLTSSSSVLPLRLAHIWTCCDHSLSASCLSTSLLETIWSAISQQLGPANLPRTACQASNCMPLQTACFDCTKYSSGDHWGSNLAHLCLLPYAILLCQTAVGRSRPEVRQTQTTWLS